MSHHSEKDAGDLYSFLSGDLPGRPEDEVVGVVLRLCEIVERLEMRVLELEARVEVTR